MLEAFAHSDLIAREEQVRILLFCFRCDGWACHQTCVVSPVHCCQYTLCVNLHGELVSLKFCNPISLSS